MTTWDAADGVDYLHEKDANTKRQEAERNAMSKEPSSDCNYYQRDKCHIVSVFTSEH